MLKRLLLFAMLCATAGAAAAEATTIYPIDRAAILAGSRFDFKVEFDEVIDANAMRVTIDGADYAAALGGVGQFVAKEAGTNASALLVRDATLTRPGRHTVVASDGSRTATVQWEVYRTGPRQARNVILFIGDGMSAAHRTAARILSKGIAEGRYRGTLAMDDMPYMALLGTAGVDSIITDSANSASAYTTGHKSSVNALGVYADRTPDTLDDPRVETLTGLVKRATKMAVGVVTNTEVEDAMPAAMVAHTRRRSDYDAIVGMFHDSRVDVLMGGGAAHFLPKSSPGSRRKDDIDYAARFRAEGYAVVTTDQEMRAAAADSATRRVLGLFHPTNMDGVLDRKFLKGGTVERYPNQPDLVDMVKSALTVLARNTDGFVLMVESGLIDKYSHPLDWERAVMDTIMLDRAVAVAREFAADRNDTLILVTADHGHGVALVGTVDDAAPGTEMRDKVGVYEKAGYPTYPAPNSDGYPDRLDVSRRLALFFAAFPDYYETFRPKTDGPFVPAVEGPGRAYVANEKYRDVPGAMLRVGNLPRNAPQGVHTGEDVVLTAVGPGAERPRLSREHRGLPHHRGCPRPRPRGAALKHRISRAAIAAMIVLAPGAVASESAIPLRFTDLYATSGPLGVAFSESAQRLRGLPVRMSGYLAPPLKAEAAFFVLCAQPVSICPFCQSDADWPQDIVVIYPRDSGWRFRSAAERVDVVGTLDLGSKLDPTTGFVSQVRLLSALVRRG